jgi:formylglycine-generating enzyme required for sulfatase activity
MGPGKVGCALCLAVAACGRVDFDPIASAGASDAPAGDAAVISPSCAGLALTCGPSGTSSCCGSPLVPGGTFYRSYDVGTDGAYPDMSNPATVSDFHLDTYEVTVGRFRQFVVAGMGTQANPPAAGAGARTLNGVANQGGWNAAWTTNLTANTAAFESALACNANTQTWTPAPGANESLPINCIDWYEAFAFCAWDNAFLPTEAEWNYAASGGSEQRAYPWSNPPSSLAIDCAHANFDNAGTYCTNPPGGGANRVGTESPTGDGKWGQADLAGNETEWVLDWEATYPNPCVDCADLTPVSSRALRGGDFSVNAPALRTAPRSNIAPTQRNGGLFGVRCARP